MGLTQEFWHAGRHNDPGRALADIETEAGRCQADAGCAVAVTVAGSTTRSVAGRHTVTVTIGRTGWVTIANGWSKDHLVRFGSRRRCGGLRSVERQLGRRRRMPGRRFFRHRDSLAALGTFSLATFPFVGNANHRTAVRAVKFYWHRAKIISVKGFRVL